MIKCLEMSEEFSKETAQRAYRAIESLLAEEETAIDLVQATLCIASMEYPELDGAQYLAQLDVLARRVRVVLSLPAPDEQPALPSALDPLEVLAALNRVLFDEEGFQGDQDDYYNPANSFFNQVLERRKGIPITLSLLYIEVGRRVGLTLDGVALPWHFMVRCSTPTGRIYIDVFGAGQLMDEQECSHFLRQRAQHRVKMQPRWFEAVSPRHFLYRMLNNLKHIYIQCDDLVRALAISDLMIVVMPRLAAERRDRGILHLQMQHYSRALRDLQVYLKLAPDASDRQELQKQIFHIRQTIALLN